MSRPHYMDSPLALFFAGVIAQDESQRAIEFAQLSAKAEEAATYRAAREHAQVCLAARSGWDVETLSHNIESNFPDLSLDDCDDIAQTALQAHAQALFDSAYAACATAETRLRFQAARNRARGAA